MTREDKCACVIILFAGLVRQKGDQYGIYAARRESGTVRRCGHRRRNRANDLDFVNCHVAIDLLSQRDQRISIVISSRVTNYVLSHQRGPEIAYICVMMKMGKRW